MNDMRPKILIVDDEPVNIRLLEETLKRDYEICTSFNGFEAIRDIKDQKPDLVLLDIMVPDMNGFDVCRVIRSDEAFSAIPVIFITAMDTIEGEVEGLEAGGIDYLSKPVNLDLLKLRVRNHLEMKRRSDIIREQRDLLESQKIELESALARIKSLEGVIPICMYCKSIRNDDKSWQKLEEYLSEHTDAMLSHGICPKCVAEYYPEINLSINK